MFEMIKSISRHREFTGPTPHSVAIVSSVLYFFFIICVVVFLLVFAHLLQPIQNDTTSKSQSYLHVTFKGIFFFCFKNALYGLPIFFIENWIFLVLKIFCIRRQLKVPFTSKIF